MASDAGFQAALTAPDTGESGDVYSRRIARRILCDARNSAGNSTSTDAIDRTGKETESEREREREKTKLTRVKSHTHTHTHTPPNCL